MNDTATDLLKQLGESLGVDSLVPDRDGSCSITFDGAVTVEFRSEAATDSLVLFSALTQLSAEQRVALAPRLLEANVFWQDTAGATLGVSANGLVILCRRELLDSLDLPRLRKVLETFINTAEVWQHLLEKAAAPAAAPKKGATAPGLLRA